MLIWCIIIVLAAVIEMLTVDLVSVWLVCGGIVGLLLNVFKFSLTIQIVGCVIVTLLAAIIIRPICHKYLRGNIIKTNIDRNIGKTVKLQKSILVNQKGEVVLNGETWSAISLNEEEIAAGEEVVILGIDGNKLIVRK